MISTALKLGRFAATLWLAFVLSLAGLTPGHSAMQASGHMGVEEAGSPCSGAMKHDAHTFADIAGDVDKDPASGSCCDAAYCSGDTVRSSEMTLSSLDYDISFVQVPPGALRRADLSLPHRPPRSL